MAKYLDENELYNEYKKSVANNYICTDKLGQYFLILTDHILRGPSFNRYPVDVKQDLQSYALEKLIKGIRNVRLEYTPRQIFNFSTRSVFNSLMTSLKSHYKYINLKKQLKKEYIQNCSYISENQRKKLLEEFQDFED